MPCAGPTLGAPRFSYAEEPTIGQNIPGVSSPGLWSRITSLDLLAMLFRMQPRTLPFPTKARCWLNPSSVLLFSLLHPHVDIPGPTAWPKPRARQLCPPQVPQLPPPIRVHHSVKLPSSSQGTDCSDPARTPGPSRAAPGPERRPRAGHRSCWHRRQLLQHG